ncbi:hypothetical protein ACFL54_06305 [Planctomycetota bacterium]
MKTDDAFYQAQKLLSFIQRGGDPVRWWKSKDFTSVRRSEIERQLKMIQADEIR